MQRSNIHRPAALVTVLLASCAAHATIYEVGDGRPYASIGAVPWESLAAGDEVRIHARPLPYREKWVIARQGTAAQPIRIVGVPAADGSLPIIDGVGATTRLALDYWNEVRAVVKIGGSSFPADVMPRHIEIANLDIRGARPPATFVDDAGGTQTYAQNAAAIFVEKGENITIRNCILRDSGNGLFVASSDTAVSRDILIESCYIHGNGNVGSGFEHNAYTAAIGITYQHNEFGPLLAGADGNNLKDRSAGLVVRYNWIESGNRQLDLVDAEDSSVIELDPRYRTTHVYGNVLIEPDGAGNKQIVHYGGDSGNTAQYRKGVLHFYNNTVYSWRASSTTCFRLSTNDEHCDARNNIFYVTHAGRGLSILDSTGVIDLTHNYHKAGWIPASSGLQGVINDDGTSIVAESPGWWPEVFAQFRPGANSVCLDAATTLHPAALPEHALTGIFSPDRSAVGRCTVGVGVDVGCYERPLIGDIDVSRRVGLEDLAHLLANFGNFGCGASGVCIADLDGDFDTDLTDLSMLLANFGTSCP
jgi:hypothetical protein